MTETKLPEINIGIVGHVDHGKTTLTYGITGKWTMAHSEELKRGITIKLGYADADIQKCSKCGAYTFETQAEPRFGGAQPKQVLARETCKCGGKAELVRKISIVDAPGHETLMAVMLAGAAIIEGAILVISANEPVPQPQTAEHLMALKVLGIKNIIVVQNKIDSITKEKAKENYEQIKKFVAETYGSELPIIPISGQRKVNLDILAEAIEEFIPTPKRDDTKEPMMFVARSFDVNRPGANISEMVGGVLGGSIIQGIFKKGDAIEMRPGIKIEKKGGQVEWKPVATKLSAIFCGSQPVDEKGPGGSIAFSTTLDPSLTKSDAFVGNVIGLPGKLPPTVATLNLKVTLFPYVIGTKEKVKIEPFKQYEPLMLNIGTATTVGIVQGAGKMMKLILKLPVCVRKGDKVAIARQVQSRWHLIGYGIVL